MESQQYEYGEQYSMGSEYDIWEGNLGVLGDGDSQDSGPHVPNPSGRAGVPKCVRCRRLKIKVTILNECTDRSARAQRAIAKPVMRRENTAALVFSQKMTITRARRRKNKTQGRMTPFGIIYLSSVRPGTTTKTFFICCKSVWTIGIRSIRQDMLEECDHWSII